MIKVSLSRAWDETRAVLVRDGRLFLWVALALFVLPGVVLDVTIPAASIGEVPAPGVWIAIAIIAVVISLVGQLAVIRLAMGPHISVGEAIAHGFRRLLPYVAAVLIWTVPIIVVAAVLYQLMGPNSAHPRPAAAVALLLLTILVIYLAVRMILASAVASAEGHGPIAILRRSWELSSGNWWRLFAFLVLFAVGALVLLLAVQSVMTLLAGVFLGGTGPLTLGGLVAAIIVQLVSALVSVVFFVMIARLYAQLATLDAQATVPSSGI